MRRRLPKNRRKPFYKKMSKEELEALAAKNPYATPEAIEKMERVLKSEMDAYDSLPKDVRERFHDDEGRWKSLPPIARMIKDLLPMPEYQQMVYYRQLGEFGKFVLYGPAMTQEPPVNSTPRVSVTQKSPSQPGQLDLPAGWDIGDDFEL